MIVTLNVYQSRLGMSGFCATTTNMSDSRDHVLVRQIEVDIGDIPEIDWKRHDADKKQARIDALKKEIAILEGEV